MNHRNYQKELEKILEKLPADGEPKKLFLHSCCAPCSSHCLEYLSRYFRITVFYYNPNISPKEEYSLRIEEIKRFVKEFKDWYLDKDRKAGDYGLVKTSYGYHIMYFSGTEPIWVFYCREAVTDKLSTENVADAMEKHEIVINYDKILLGDVKLIEDK